MYKIFVHIFCQINKIHWRGLNEIHPTWPDPDSNGRLCLRCWKQHDYHFTIRSLSLITPNALSRILTDIWSDKSTSPVPLEDAKCEVLIKGQAITKQPDPESNRRLPPKGKMWLPLHPDQVMAYFEYCTISTGCSEGVTRYAELVSCLQFSAGCDPWHWTQC